MPSGTVIPVTASKHLHTSDVGVGQEPRLGMAVHIFRSVTGIVAFLKMKKTKRSCFLLSVKWSPMMIWMVGCCWLRSRNQFFLINPVTCQVCNRVTTRKQTQGYSYIWHMHFTHQGHKVAYVRTVDSDVVVLAVRFFRTLGLEQCWVGFGSGKSYRDIPIHNICVQLGPSNSLALPLFHALTGCDTTTHFLGCGKKTAWQAWTCYPDLTETLIDLTQDPTLLTLASIHMQRLERFVVLMYNRRYSAARVNNARVHLFTRGMCSLEKLPPTQAALFEHAKRALLQASYHWNKATTPVHALPDFNSWGWFKSDQGVWCPYWTSLPDANKACAILLRCGCLKSCIGNCKCSKAGVRCTSLCKCEAGCINNTDDLWYHLLCSVHYGLYVNRIYMQCDKNCMNQIYMTIIAWIHVLFSPY